MIGLAVHLPPAVTIAMAAVVVAWVVWYWQQLGRPGVPPSRRIIRRLSLVVVTGSLPIYIAAASFYSAEADGVAYVRIWMAAMAMLSVIVLLAIIDVVNNLRLHRIESAEHHVRSLRDMASAITKAKQRSGQSDEVSTSDDDDVDERDNVTK